MKNKNLYIVSSALRIIMGVFTYEQRFEQTLKTFESIRRKDPNAIILLADISLDPIPEEHMKIINEKVDVYIDLSQNEQVRRLTMDRQKNLSEIFTLLNVIHLLKTQNQTLEAENKQLKERIKQLEKEVDDYKRI